MMKNKILIFSATYNEAKNIENFLKLIEELNLPLDILLIDDNSPDNTWKLIQEYSKNKENAISLLEFLTNPKSQKLYSSMNYEYPVNPTMTLSAELKSWGTFKEDKLPIEKLAELASIAQKIIDRVGW